METILLTIAINVTSNGLYSIIGRLIPNTFQYQARIAYEKSLKRWSKNRGIREYKRHFANRRFVDYLQQIKNPVGNIKTDSEIASFLKIFEEESVKLNTLNNYIQRQISKHQNCVLEDISIDVKRLLPDTANAEKKEYNAPPYYISRTVIGDDNGRPIINIIKEDSFVMLKAPAGAGKSTEILHIAHKLSNEDKFVRIIRLIDFATNFTDLVNSYFKNWRNIPATEKIFLLLDGLDEASEDTTLQSQIKQFSIANSHINILVTYRNSYSYFLSEISKKKEEKQDDKINDNVFKITELELNSLTIEDIKQYILHKNGSISLFDNLKSKNLIELCSNPFYLNLYVELFDSQKEIIESKSQLFEEILKERFKTEKRKGNLISRVIGNSEFKTQQALSTLALTMQTAGVYDISNNDFQLIVDDEKTGNCCKRMVLFQIGVYENWKFEHNNFQEFLAAKELLKLDYDKTSKLIFLEDGLLKRSWFNTIDFYLSLKESDDRISESLLYKILEVNPESLVKLDKNNFDLGFRYKIFKRVYQKYKQKEIVLYSVITADELVAFVDLKTQNELIEFLIQEINPDLEIHNLYNIIELLDKAKIFQPYYQNRIANELLLFLDKEKYKEYSIHASILGLFEEYKWGTKETINVLLENQILYNFDYTRASFLKYLFAIEYKDLTAEKFLEFITKAKKNKSITMDFYVIVQLVKHLPDSEFTKLLLEISLDPSEITYYRADYNDLLKEIVNRSIERNSSDENILPAFKDMMIRAIKNFHWRQEELFKSFFIETKQLFESFREEFNKERLIPNSNRLKFIISGFLADEICINWCVNDFTTNDINKDEIWDFYGSLNYNQNYKLAAYFLEQINLRVGDKFEMPIQNQYEKIQKEAHRIYCQAILDINQYKNLAKPIFVKRNITNFDKSNFFVVDRTGNELSSFEQASEIVVRRFVHDWKQEITIQRNHNFIDKEWNGFQKHLHLKLNKSDAIPTDNQTWIKNWCIKNENTIDFENAITQGKEVNEHSITYAALDYLSLIKKIDYLPNREICLVLIKCITTVDRSYVQDVKQYNLFDELRKVITDKQFISKIHFNLSNNNLPFILVNSHIQMAEELNARIITPEMVKFILNTRVEYWQRNNWLRVYFKLNGAVNDVVPILDELELKTENEWSIVDTFIDQDKVVSNEFLIKFLSDDHIDRSKYAMNLIKVGNIEGYNEAYRIMSEKQNADVINEWRFSTPEKWLHEAQFNAMEIIPLLVKSINLQLKDGFKNYESNPSIGILFNTLKFYLNGYESSMWKSIENEIEEALEGSFEKNGNTKNYQIITRFFQQIKEEMILKLDRIKTIENAKKELDNILYN